MYRKPPRLISNAARRHGSKRSRSGQKPCCRSGHGGAPGAQLVPARARAKVTEICTEPGTARRTPDLHAAAAGKLRPAGTSGFPNIRRPRPAETGRRSAAKMAAEEHGPTGPDLCGWLES